MTNKYNRIIYTIIWVISFIVMCLIDYTSVSDFIASVLVFVIFFVSFMSFMFTFENKLYFVRAKNIKKALYKNIKPMSDEEIIDLFKYVGLANYSPNIVKVFYNEDNTRRVIIGKNEFGASVIASKLNIIDKDEYFTFMDYAFWDFDYSLSSGDYYENVETALNDCEHLLENYHEEKIPNDISNTFFYTVIVSWKAKKLKKELPFGSSYPVTILIKKDKIKANIHVTNWFSLNQSNAYLCLHNLKLSKNTRFKIIENNEVIAKGKVLF